MPVYIESSPPGQDTYISRLSNADNFGFSPEKSFVSPSKGGRDDLRQQLRGGRGIPVLATPRQPLANLRQQPTRAEFTPLLKSAARNRVLQSNGRVDGNLATPLGLKAGYNPNAGTPLPEASSMLDASSSVVDNSGTPQPPVQESSMTMSTPIPQMPKRGDMGMEANGNVLTLREQEAVCSSKCMHSERLRANVMNAET